MSSVGQRILPGSTVVAVREETLLDRQEGCMNYEVVVTMTQRVPMIFPMTGFVLSSPRGSNARLLVAEVKMPVERPLFK